MLTTQQLGEVLFELRHLAYLIFNEKFGDYGSLVLATTILVFLLDIKQTFQLRKLKGQLRVCMKKLEGCKK